MNKIFNFNIYCGSKCFYTIVILYVTWEMRSQYFHQHFWTNTECVNKISGQQFLNLRSFPKGTKSCCTIKLSSNYDKFFMEMMMGKDILPSFDSESWFVGFSRIQRRIQHSYEGDHPRTSENFYVHLSGEHRLWDTLHFSIKV